MINWIPIEKLDEVEMRKLENHDLIFYVEQKKACRREFPEIITGSVVVWDYGPDINFVDHQKVNEKLHDPENGNLRWHSGWISKITHYAEYNDPWEKELENEL